MVDHPVEPALRTLVVPGSLLPAIPLIVLFLSLQGFRHIALPSWAVES